MATGGNALQQGRTLSHRASRLMRLRPGVGIEPRLVGLKGGPIDEAGMMVGDEHRPLLDGKMTYPFPDGAVFIDVAFVASFTVGVSASIHRIGQNVVDRGVGPAIQTVGGALRGKEGGGGVVETENGRNARAAVRWVRMRERERFMAMDGPES